MSMDQASIMKKGLDFAERATAEDRAGNYDIAAEAYMAAAEWFIHVTKYGIMSPTTKQQIRDKVDSYLSRTEKLKKSTEKKSTEKKSTEKKSPKSGPVSSEPSSADNDDPDKARMMQRFADAIVADPNVSFDEVVGLDQAKTALQEAVILPVRFPKLFQGRRKPWAGILLYGPPGTGKSYLAKALATECESTFISISSSDILSKWLGEAEKGVKSLFELARERQPCIIFIDEMDALCGQRNDSKSEASSRVLTEFLVQMQGVGTNNTGVLVLAATNIPWSLDTAIRRRLEKRIYIPLPEVNERAAMFKTHLGTDTHHTIKENEWIQLAQKANHYSGADIAVVCREALLRPIRRLNGATHFKRIPNPDGKPGEPTHVWLACSPGDPDAKEMSLYKIHPDEICVPPVTTADMLAALATQRPTVGEKELLKFQEFTQEFGQEGV